MHWSSREPEVKMTPLKDEKMEVELRGIPSLFAVAEDGFQSQWAFYDWPERTLTDLHQTRYLGKILIAGEEHHEYLILDFNPNKSYQLERETRWYYTVREDRIVVTRLVDRPMGRVAVEEEIEGWEELIHLSVGAKFTSTGDVYRCGNRIRYGSGPMLEEVTGVAEVEIEGRKFRCLQYLWVPEPVGREKQERLLAAERYIDQNGRCIFFRRYNGRGWDNLDKLKDSPKLEHEGEIFYLWYDCIPEYALTSE